MIIKMPMTCFLLLAYSFYYYKKTKRIRTHAAAIFEIMLCCVLLNLLSDGVTQYTVNHRDTVSETMNYVWHIIFLESMLSICFLMYYYLITYVERGTGSSKRAEKQISLVVWISVAAAILALPIVYIDTKHGSYSLGAKAYALYTGAVYVMILMGYNLFKYWGQVERKKREVMLTSIVIFMAFSILQMIFPYILMTGLGMTMMVMGILLTAEDSNQYIDDRQGFFNELGCREMLREQISREKAFEIPVYMFIGNLAQVEQHLRTAAAYMSEQYDCVPAMVSGNIMAFFPHESFWLRRERYYGDLPQIAEGDNSVREFSMVLRGGRYTTEEEIMEKLQQFKIKNEEDILYRDAMSDVYNRNAYERDIVFLQAQKKSLWYFLADINGLKTVNDTFGHAAGDELIQIMAMLLKQTFSKESKIYRFGGDEFVILYMGKQAEKIADDLEKGCARINEGREIPLRFAVGYAYYDAQKEVWEEIVRRADFNMYADKIKDKERR